MLPLLCLAAQAQPRFDSDRVTVHFQEVDRGRAARCLELLHAALERVPRKLGQPAPDHVTLFLARGEPAFARALSTLGAGAQPDWALAVALPESQSMVVRAHRLEGALGGGLAATLDHETAHLVLAPLRSLPRWLHEGLASWAEGRSPGYRDQLNLALAARSGALPGLADLEHGFPAEGAHADLAYLMALSLVRRVEEEGAAGSVAALVQAVAQTGDVEAAWERVTGQDLPSYADRWGRDQAARYGFFEYLLGLGGAFTLAGLLAMVAIWRHRRRRARLLARMPE